MTRVEKKLGMTSTVPKDQRGNVCSGYMTLVGGRAGLMMPPENYHMSDINGMFFLKKYVQPVKKNKYLVTAKGKASTKATATATAAAAVDAQPDTIVIDEADDPLEVVEGSNNDAGVAAEEGTDINIGQDDVVEALTDVIVQPIVEIGPPRIRYFEIRVLDVDELSNCDQVQCSTIYIYNDPILKQIFCRKIFLIATCSLLFLHRKVCFYTLLSAYNLVNLYKFLVFFP